MARAQADFGLLHARDGALLHHVDGIARHGPRATAPRNLAFVPYGDRAWLIVFDAVTGGSLGVLASGPDGIPVLAAETGAPSWRFDVEGQFLTMCDAGQYLSADTDGAVRLRAAPGPDTRFFVLSRQADACLASLHADRWIYPSGQRWAGALTFAPAPGLDIGGQTIDPTGVPGPFVAESAPAGSGRLRQMLVVGPAGRMHVLALYRPIICFAAFGEDSYFSALGVAVSALRRFGAYDGALCIAADRERADVAAFLPESAGLDWIHVKLAPGERLFARYGLPDWGLEAFQPVLYLDVDIVANAPLRPMLSRLATTQRVHVSTETRLWRQETQRRAASAVASLEGNWFGAWLFAGDKRMAGRPMAYGSSGVIGADTTERLRTSFALVQALRHAASPAMVEQYHDQALLNYALHASGHGEFNLLDGFVDFTRDAETAPAQRRGLLHFHSGVGRGPKKYRAMLAYAACLEAAPDVAEAWPGRPAAGV
jgi:hypothetical protein